MGATPILTRLYSPHDMGEFAQVFALVSMLTVLSTLRLGTLLLTNNRQLKARRAAAVSVRLILLCATAVSIGYCVTFRRPLEFNDFLYGLGVLATLISFALFDFSSYYLVSRGEYRKSGLIKAVRAAITSAIQVILGYAFALGLWGLLLGEFIGRMLVSFQAMRRPLLQAIRWNKRELIRTSAFIKKRKGFLLFSVPTAALNTVSLNIYPIIIAPTFGTAVAGSFFLIQRILGAPLALMGIALAQVYLKHANSQNADKGKPLNHWHVLSFNCLGALLIFSALAAVLFFFEEDIFGTEWKGIAQSAFLLIPAFVAQLSTAPFSQMLIAKNRSGIQLILDIFRIFSYVGLYFFAHFGTFKSSSLAFGYYAIVAIAYYGMQAGLGIHLKERTR